jgi:hypothetical protein
MLKLKPIMFQLKRVERATSMLGVAYSSNAVSNTRARVGADSSETHFGCSKTIALNRVTNPANTRGMSVE